MGFYFQVGDLELQKDVGRLLCFVSLYANTEGDMGELAEDWNRLVWDDLGQEEKGRDQT